MKNLEIEKRYIPINQYTRPGRELATVDILVVHWTGYPGGNNEGLWNWFAEIAPKQKRYGSTQFGIDDNGIIQFMPEMEMAYHVGAKEYTDTAEEFFKGMYPNAHSIGVELNHLDWDGRFSETVLDRAVDLFAYLCHRYDVDPITRIWRHFDVTGKDCPRWFVNHEEEFEWFKKRVAGKL